jgi:hypothetical protein
MRTAKRPIQLLCFFYVEVMNNEDRVNGLVILKWFSKIARSEGLVTIQEIMIVRFGLWLGNELMLVQKHGIF